MQNASGYQWDMIGTTPLGNGITAYTVIPTAGHFTFQDQDNHVLGIANNVSIPSDSSNPGYYMYEDVEANDQGGPHTANCSWADATFTQLNLTDDTWSAWPEYYGCFANGGNGDNDTYGGLDNQVNGVNSGTHQACHGGQGSQNAPLDTYLAGTYPNVTNLHHWLEESNPSESPGTVRPAPVGVHGSTRVPPGVTPQDPATATAEINTPPAVGSATLTPTK